MLIDSRCAIMDDGSWKPFLQRNRTYLVRNVDFDNTELWDAVQEQGIVTGIQVESLRANNNSNFRRVGAFIDHLLRRDRSQYDRFMAALVTTGQDHVVAYLEQQAGPGAQVQDIPRATVPAYTGGMPGFVAPCYAPPARQRGFSPMECSPSHNPARTGPTTFDASPVEPPVIGTAPEPVSPVEIMEIKRTLSSLKLEEDLKPSTKEWFENEKKKHECYPVKYETRGRAIVITMTGQREGWKEDVKNIAKMLKYLDFLADFEFDLKYQEYMEKLKEFAESGMNGHVDCAWVILMGHGGCRDNKDYIMSRDGKAVYINDTLKKTFNNNICLALQQKPKAFIVQMCRGDKADKGVTVKKDKIQADASKVVKLGTFTDYLFGYATQPDYEAFRDTEKGSWYIQKLTEIFMQKAAYTSVTDMLTQVNREVGKLETKGADSRKEGYVQTTEINSALDRKWYLAPGLHSKKS